jgi:hypothetical protein
MNMGGGDLEFALAGTASARNDETLTKGLDPRNKDLHATGTLAAGPGATRNITA